MSKMKTLILSMAATSFGIAAVGALSAPKLRAAVKAAFVEVVIPGAPFSDSMVVSASGKKSIGPETGMLGISSITLTNFDSSAQQVFLFAPVFSSGGCGGAGALIIGGGGPQMTVYVQPRATMHLTYPTPLVFRPLEGHTCIAAQVTTALNGGSVHVDVNGFVN